VVANDCGRVGVIGGESLPDDCVDETGALAARSRDEDDDGGVNAAVSTAKGKKAPFICGGDEEDDGVVGVDDEVVVVTAANGASVLDAVIVEATTGADDEAEDRERIGVLVGVPGAVVGGVGNGVLLLVVTADVDDGVVVPAIDADDAVLTIESDDGEVTNVNGLAGNCSNGTVVSAPVTTGGPAPAADGAAVVAT
jgi:hypothetical protein